MAEDLLSDTLGHRLGCLYPEQLDQGLDGDPLEEDGHDDDHYRSRHEHVLVGQRVFVYNYRMPLDSSRDLPSVMTRP